MKQLILTHISLLLLLIFSPNMSAQDFAVCEDQGFEIQSAGTPTACAGSNTGQATVASTGCSCMFSGCTYAWSDGQTFHTAFNLSAGTYSVTVTHPPDSLGNICEVTVDVVIEDGEEMIDNINLTELSCMDGEDATATVIPSIFAGQLNYQWSNGQTEATATGLSAGTYAVVVSNFENCVEQIEVVIPPSTSAFGIDDISGSPACGGLANGKIDLTVSGSDNYTVLAVDGDDNEYENIDELAAGYYEIFVTSDSGCIANSEITIEEGDLHVDINASEESTCAGNEIALQALTAQEATFSWSPVSGLDDPTSASPTATPSETTTYTVTVETADGCSAVKEVTIEVEPTPNISIIYNGDLQICNGEFKNVVASVSEATSYVWEPTTGVSGTNAVYLSPTETTTYTVTASLPNGCSVSEEITIEVENCGAVAVNDIDVIDNIYPNPSQGIFNLIAKELINNYAVYDITGKLIQQTKVMNNAALISLENKPVGIYFLNVNTNEGSQMVKLLKR